MVLKSPLSPVEIPDNVSLPDFILSAAAKYGSKTAYIDFNTKRSLTYQQLLDQVAKVSSALLDRGFQKNDVVFLLAPNCIEYPVILHAVTKIGGILTTCNPIYTEVEILQQLRDSGSKYIITIPENKDKVQAAAKKYGNLKEMFLIGAAYPGFSTYHELTSGGQSVVKTMNFDPKEQVCLLPYSSGTTGPPKGVMLTHHNVISMVAQISHPDLNVMMPGREVLIGFLPFFHCYAICVYLTWALTEGATIVLMTNFDMKDYLQAIQDYKGTFLHIVPPIAIRLAKDPIVRNYDVSSVHTIISGAAPLGKEQAEELMERMGVESVRQGYGLTETSTVSNVAPIKGWKHGSVGYLLPNLQAKVIDTSSGKELGPKQKGELLFRGPSIMKGYLGRDHATKETVDENGWLHSGDIGYYEDDGHYYIVDRVKELIKYNGLQVAPAELEGHLLTNPSIADCAVIGIPDANAGELPKAYVVLKPGHVLSESDVHGWLKGKVAPYKKLRGGVEFVDSIPKSVSGKILRRILKQRNIKATPVSKL